MPFLPERMKVKKVERVGNFHYKTDYVLRIRILKQALSNGLVIGLNTDLSKKAKNNFEKIFLS